MKIISNTAPHNGTGNGDARRRRPQTLAFGLAAMGLFAVAALGAVSCATPEATFYVVTPTAATPSTVDGSILCTTTPLSVVGVYVPTCKGAPVAGAGVASCFMVRSELTASADPTNARIEKRTIIMQSSDATLQNTGGGKFPTTGFVDAATAAPSEAIVVGILATGADGPAFINAGSGTGSIIFKGRTTGGIDVETPEYFFEAQVIAFELDACKQ